STVTPATAASRAAPTICCARPIRTTPGPRRRPSGTANSAASRKRRDRFPDRAVCERTAALLRRRGLRRAVIRREIIDDARDLIARDRRAEKDHAIDDGLPLGLGALRCHNAIETVAECAAAFDQRLGPAVSQRYLCRLLTRERHARPVARHHVFDRGVDLIGADLRA